MHPIVEARHLTLCDARFPTHPNCLLWPPVFSCLHPFCHVLFFLALPLSLLSVTPPLIFSPIPELQLLLNILRATRVLNNRLRASVCVTWGYRRVCVSVCVCEVKSDFTVVMSQVGGVVLSLLKGDWPIVQPGHEGMYKKAMSPTLIISSPQSINNSPWRLSFL